jgi:hypothetical protein
VNRVALVLALVLGLAALLVVSKRKQAEIARGLPPRIVCANQGEAFGLAGLGATPVLGTGSMAPWIPAALPGLDPRQTVVAYAVIDTAATYDGITTGALVVYFAAWAGGRVIHQAAAKDSGGWIMSGLHNERSETWERVTAKNYIGTVARVYVWVQ